MTKTMNKYCTRSARACSADVLIRRIQHHPVLAHILVNTVFIVFVMMLILPHDWSLRQIHI
jgi:hypothetical protein